MSVPIKQALNQGQVVAALGRVVRNAIDQKFNPPQDTQVQCPGPEFSAVVQPRDPELVREFVRWSGGKSKAWRDKLPPSLFPQWGFPLLSRTVDDLPYPLLRILNGGCRMEIHEPLPDSVPLHLSACLEEVDDNGRRVLLKERLYTGIEPGHHALTSHIYAIVPLGNKGSSGPKKERPKVPSDAQKISDLPLSQFDGLAFACLTGDFNPIHWIPPLAWLQGFKNNILHGFGTMSRSIEAMTRELWSGDSTRLKVIDVRFTKPLVLPRRVSLFVREDELYVAEKTGRTPYLMGTFETR